MALIRKLARMLMDRVARLDRRATWTELSVVLMDDDEMTSLNRQYLGRREPTDVLSFRYVLRSGIGRCFAGEVAANVACALREGPGRGGPSRELALYIAHGCDHIAGGSDRTSGGRRRMRARETRWLREIGREVDLSRILKPLP